MGSVGRRRQDLALRILSFWGRLISFSGGSIWLTVAIACGAALAEAVGILLIIPFLAVQGLPATGWQSTVISALGALGLSTPTAQIFGLLLLFLVLFALRAVLTWLRAQRVTRLSVQFANAQRRRLYSAVAGADWKRLVQQSRVGIEHALVEDSLRIEVAAQSAVFGLVTGVAILLQTCVAFAVAPVLTLIAVAIFLATALALRPFLSRAKRLGTDTTRVNKDMFELLGAFLSGLKVARVSGRQKAYLAQFEDGLRAQEAIALRAATLQVGQSLGFQLITLLAICLIFAVALGWLGTSFAVLSAIVLLLMRMSGPIQSLLAQLQVLAVELPALDALEDRVQRLSGAVVAVPEPAAAAGHVPVITIENATIQFETDAPLWSGVTDRFHPGEIIGVAGPSGAGKTSFLDMVSGLLPPTHGYVEVAGLPPARAFWSGRYRLGYLVQSPVWLETTLRDALGADRADADMWAALETVELKTRFAGAPLGLDSPIADQANSLSGGEAQRLALARLFLSRYDVIILDEATNAMDTALEARILSRITQLAHKPTLLLVSHRAEVLALSDRIIDLERV